MNFPLEIEVLQLRGLPWIVRIAAQESDRFVDGFAAILLERCGSQGIPYGGRFDTNRYIRCRRKYS